MDSDANGDQERRFASHDQATSDLALKAAERAIADARIDKNQIDLVVSCDYHA